MKNSLFLILCLILISNLSSCSIFDNENEEAVVTAVIESDDLVIRNGLHFDIYYFAVAQSALPYIFWEPQVEDYNRVPRDSFRVTAADSLYAYTSKEPVVVFYWDEDISEIFSILIE